MFKFPKSKHEYKFTRSEHSAFRIKDRLPVSVWAEKHFKLTKAYVNPGRFFVYPWQREPLDALNEYDLIYFLGPVQTGKSVMAEVCVGYSIDNYSLNGMLIYANEKTAAKVFKYRIRPSIEQIPALRKYWSGKDDDLTIKNIELQNCIWGIASAENKNDIASFPAGFICASEVSKYRSKDFNQIAMMRGRQQAYLSRGLYKRLLESSPYNTGDIFYNEIYKSGTLILDPFVPCPHCGHYQVLTDSQIFEVCPDGVETKDSARIRRKKDLAVRYECEKCTEEIKEGDRPGMMEKVVWAAPKIEEGKYCQDAEEVTKNGNVLCDREGYEAVCFNWNRLVDSSYKFYECLARFFESRKSPETFRVYQNEDMARFYKIKTSRLDGDSLLTKCLGYLQDSKVPRGVKVVVCGMDTQDSGFYYEIRGFGRNMESWLLRHGFIECSVNDELFKDRSEIFSLFQEELLSKPLTREDGASLNIKFGFIDRGGHRPADVDHLCNNIPWLHGYIGSTIVNPKLPMIKKSEKESFYLGQTQLFSEQVAQYIETDIWHLPEDVEEDYLTQITAQYGVEEESKHGVVKIKWVCLKNDHYRDCCNLSFASAKILNLDLHLFTEDGMMMIDNTNTVKVQGPVEEIPKKKHRHAFNRGGGQSGRRWSR